MLSRFVSFCLTIVVAACSLQAQVNVFTRTGTGNDSLKIAAKTLFQELSRSGQQLGTFEIRGLNEFSGKGFLMVERTDAENSGISFPAALKKMGPEGIWIKANERSATIIGNSSLAVTEAVYIYLEQLGFRYFLPGDTWTIVPSLNSVYKKLDILIEPHYEFRTIANGHAYLNLARPKEEYDNWYRANRMGGSFSVWLGHNYHGIVSTREDVFKQHPEYFAGNVEKGQIPIDPKFNVANKELVKLIKDIAEKEI